MYTLVLSLPNSRGGPTTATSKGSPLAPWFGLLLGLSFLPSCVVWASQMHQGLSILSATRQHGSTAAAPKGM